MLAMATVLTFTFNCQLSRLSIPWDSIIAKNSWRIWHLKASEHPFRSSADISLDRVLHHSAELDSQLSMDSTAKFDFFC